MKNFIERKRVVRLPCLGVAIQRALAGIDGLRVALPPARCNSETVHDLTPAHPEAVEEQDKVFPQLV